jgi:hypothetical protein
MVSCRDQLITALVRIISTAANSKKQTGLAYYGSRLPVDGKDRIPWPNP